jgi:hypothetical protein
MAAMIRAGWSFACAFALCACATVPVVAPGTPESDIRARYGEPTAVYTIGDTGHRRLEYATGPYGQQTTMVDLDASGRALRAWPALTDAHFAAIRLGTDTQATIRAEYGTPFHLVKFHLTGLTPWDYPYRDATGRDAVLTVYFDANEVAVRVEAAPDPRRAPHDGHLGYSSHDRR